MSLFYGFIISFPKIMTFLLYDFAQNFPEITTTHIGECEVLHSLFSLALFLVT